MRPCTRASRPGDRRKLRDDVRGQLILDEADAVAQLELALLQALNLQKIRPGGTVQRLDRGIEVAVLLS